MFLKRKVGKDGSYISLNRNPEYLNVTNGMMNLRWLKWFIETDYCKKHWESNIEEFKKYVKRLDKMPIARKRIVQKYETS